MKPAGWLLLCVIAAISCTKEDCLTGGFVPFELRASVVETKTELGESNDGVRPVLWCSDDEVGVIAHARSTTNAKPITTVNTLSLVVGAGTSGAVFSGTVNEVTDPVYAVAYPGKCLAASRWRSSDGVFLQTKLTLAETQTVCDGSQAPCSGVADGTTSVSLAQCCALLKVGIGEEAANRFSKITIRSRASGEYLTGSFFFCNGAPYKYSTLSGVSTTVTFAPPGGSIPQGTYYLAVFARRASSGEDLVLSNGLELDAYDLSGTLSTKLLSSEPLTIRRGYVHSICSSIPVGRIDEEGTGKTVKLSFDLTKRPEGIATALANLTGGASCKFNLCDEDGSGTYEFTITRGSSAPSWSNWFFTMNTETFLGLPAIEGYSLKKVTVRQGASDGTTRKLGLTSSVGTSASALNVSSACNGACADASTKLADYVFPLDLPGHPVSGRRYYIRCAEAKSGVSRLTLEYAQVDGADITIPSAYSQVRIQSLNFANDPGATSVGHSWSGRRDAIVSQIKTVKPTVMGCQEFQTHMLYYLDNNLSSDYSWVGYDVETGAASVPGSTNTVNHQAVLFYRKADVSLVSSGVFWLSSTPDVPSVCWDDEWNGKRECVWGKFKLLSNGQQFYVFSLHGGIGSSARANGLALVATKVQEINNEDLPMFVIGDMNRADTGTEFEPLRDILHYARGAAATTDNLYSFNDWGGSSTYWIDHILFDGAKAVGWKTDNTVYCGVTYMSDHYPVYADFKMPNDNKQ